MAIEFLNFYNTTIKLDTLIHIYQHDYPSVLIERSIRVSALTKAPILAAIYIYPLKSCRGISAASARLDARGLQHDRNWMVVNAKGRFLTQRQLPRLALVQTALEPKFLR